MRNRRHCIVALWGWLILGTLVAGTTFGSDRWDGPRVLHAALARAGRECQGLADNDLTRLFVGADGGLYFETEDRITYRATLEDGKLVAADVVDEVSVAEGAQAERGRFGKVDGYWVGLDTR